MGPRRTLPKHEATHQAPELLLQVEQEPERTDPPTEHRSEKHGDRQENAGPDKKISVKLSAGERHLKRGQRVGHGQELEPRGGGERTLNPGKPPATREHEEAQDRRGDEASP